MVPIKSFDQLYKDICDKADKSTVKEKLDQIRKNLIVLLAQSDQIDLGASIEDFGGEATIRESILNAIENLMTLGQLFNVSLVEKAAAVAVAKEVSTEKAEISIDSKEGAAASGIAGKPEEAIPGDESNAAGAVKNEEQLKPPPPPDSSKEDIIEIYTKKMNEAASEEALATVWKEITLSKELTGLQKNTLQGLKSLASKKLKGK